LTWSDVSETVEGSVLTICSEREFSQHRQDWTEVSMFGLVFMTSRINPTKQTTRSWPRTTNVLSVAAQGQWQSRLGRRRGRPNAHRRVTSHLGYLQHDNSHPSYQQQYYPPQHMWDGVRQHLKSSTSQHHDLPRRSSKLHTTINAVRYTPWHCCFLFHPCCPLFHFSTPVPLLFILVPPVALGVP
jgi:hypothetical protein